MPLFCVCFCLKVSYQTYGAPSVVQLVKNPPDSAEDTRDMDSIPGPGGSPRAEMATQSSVSCLENSMAEEPGGQQSMGLQRVEHD